MIDVKYNHSGQSIDDLLRNGATCAGEIKELKRTLERLEKYKRGQALRRGESEAKVVEEPRYKSAEVQFSIGVSTHKHTLYFRAGELAGAIRFMLERRKRELDSIMEELKKREMWDA